MHARGIGLLPLQVWAESLLEAVGLKDPYEKVEKLPAPPRPVPPAPTAAELEQMRRTGDWSRWTPEEMYQRHVEIAARERSAWQEGVKQAGGSGGSYIGPVPSVECSWYEHFDAQQGECVFGSTALWLVGGTAIFLLLLAAVASAGATAGLRVSGAVLDR